MCHTDTSMLHNIAQVYLLLSDNEIQFNKCSRIPKGQWKMDNPEKLPTYIYTQNKKNQKQLYVGHQHMQTNTNNVYKTRVILQTTGGKDDKNIVFMQHHNGTQKVKTYNNNRRNQKSDTMFIVLHWQNTYVYHFRWSEL